MANADESLRLAAEQRARLLIDKQLADAGWSVQDKWGLNLIDAQGVPVLESVMSPGHGRADYLQYVDKSVVEVIEAKSVPGRDHSERVESSRGTRVEEVDDADREGGFGNPQ